MQHSGLSSGKIVALRTGYVARLRDEREFLPAALEIIETPASPIGLALGATIVATAIFALIWSCVGKVDIIATAGGHLLPIGKTKTIQPLETGVVTAIRVSDGDHVQSGQVLIELDPTEATANLDKLNHDFIQTQLDLSGELGLQAALETGNPPVLVRPPNDAPLDLVATARAAMQSRAVEEKANLVALDQQAMEKIDEAQEAASTIAKLQASIPIVAQQTEIRRKLMVMQFGNKLAWLEATQRLSEMQHDVQALAHHREEALASKAALDRQRDAAAAEYAKTLHTDLEKTRSQLSDEGSELTKLNKKLTYEVLRAPIAGTVQQLAIHTIGGVVTPAEPILAIVPDDPGLIIEANVENKDVGFVHAGQKAQVKIDAFNFTRYGLIEGTVTSLSRDVVLSNSHAPSQNSDPKSDGPAEVKESYVAHINLARNWIQTENGIAPFGPGMQVVAEIKTGERSIISYLLSPLIKHIEEAAHER